MFGGWNWGYGGSGSYVNVNANRAMNIDRNFNRDNIGDGGRWQHQSDHRKGVAYRDTPPASNSDRTGRAPTSASSSAASRTRLRDPAAAGGPGGGRNRPAVLAPEADRPGAGWPGGAGPGGGGRGAGGPAARRRRWRRAGGVDRGQQVNRVAQRGQPATASANRAAASES